MSQKQRLQSVRVFDCDLAGSQGLHHIAKAHPEIYVEGGIMERGNFSAAAGFGSEKGRQGIFSTFSAFLEMCVSEVTMSRLNFSNVLSHFSHSGVDDMADNTCHFGINSMFADGGVKPGNGDDTTRLYFPADQHQFKACLKKIYPDPGLRFPVQHPLGTARSSRRKGQTVLRRQSVRARQGRHHPRSQRRRVHRQFRRAHLPLAGRRHPAERRRY